MNKITLGILAHVDAGKTSLAESILYNSGSVKSIGRVDKGNAFLDTFNIEKQRGITVYSKEAYFKIGDSEFYLLDTPGHKDFSSDMERTLRVLDIAILVVSANDKVQSHTKTIWNLLEKYNIPTIIFINKMDMEIANANEVLKELKSRLSDNCINFNDEKNLLDNISMVNDEVFEYYMNNDNISSDYINKLFNKRKLFPCYFGSALKNFGVSELLEGLKLYSKNFAYPSEFGAKIFKVSRDKQNTRLTHLKITGGNLKVKDSLKCFNNENQLLWEEKVDEIRVYSGVKYQNYDVVSAGTVCVVSGLSKSISGENLGFETTDIKKQLESVFTYKVNILSDIDAGEFINKMYEIGEEQPDLQVSWNIETKEILIRIMGKVQLEILKNSVKERYNVDIDFEDGNIIYKETIKETVEGVGHFEPLRHYSEVHLKMEPTKRGNGLLFSSELSEDILDKNWQKLILSHLREKEHRGILTNSAITDMKITLVNGSANKKHTSSGDFREATFRALRQGLMQTNCILLEPYYSFSLIVPTPNLGRAMYDLEIMNSKFDGPITENGLSIINGTCAVSKIQDYYQDVLSYTKGEGELNLAFYGYDICVNSEEVIKKIDYDIKNDTLNHSSSVFCENGSSFIVKWDKVFDYMHLPLTLKTSKKTVEVKQTRKNIDNNISRDEIEEIFNKTYFANSGKKDNRLHKSLNKRENYFDKPYKTNEKKIKYLLIDGYNVIFSWEDLKEIAHENISAARESLINRINNYQAYRNINIIIVFDAYRVSNHSAEVYRDGNVEIVYTKQAQTADSYIEKFAHQEKDKYQVSVVTSDNLEQIIVRANNALVISSRQFLDEVKRIESSIKEYSN